MHCLKSRAKVFSDGFWHSVHKWWRTSGCSFGGSLQSALRCWGCHCPFWTGFLSRQTLKKAEENRLALAHGGPRDSSCQLQKAEVSVVPAVSLSVPLAELVPAGCQVWMKVVDGVGLYITSVNAGDFLTLLLAPLEVGLRELNETTFSAFLRGNTEIFSTEAQVTVVG